MKKTQNHGITLITLAITIVVVIILAGITISSIVGDDGLIKRAQEATEESERHSRNEELDRKELYDAWVESDNNGSGTQGGNTTGGATSNEIKSDKPLTQYVYSGKEQKWIPNVTNANNAKLVQGKDYTVEYSTSDFVNAGTITVTIKGCGNYKGTITENYTIERANLTVRTLDLTKEYDGTALTPTDDDVVIEGLVNGETIKVILTGSQTEAGKSASAFEVEEGTAKLSNYNLTKIVGTLSVKRTQTPTTPQ